MKYISDWIKSDIPKSRKFNFSLLDSIMVKSLTDFEYKQSWMDTEESGQLNDLFFVGVEDGEFFISDIEGLSIDESGSIVNFKGRNSERLRLHFQYNTDYPKTFKDFVSSLDKYFMLLAERIGSSLYDLSQPDELTF